MYEQMYKLDEVIEFFKNEDLYNIEEDRIKEMYGFISNPYLRVNDTDKQWVAYTSQESEVTTVANAMKEIFRYSRLAWTKEEDKVIDTIHQVGDIFIQNQTTMKPRIPFYIIVLDKLKD
ncbi:MAG: Unknown protein [uncultured Sulfurovum sp.]|uniref:Uncharacterized protein n=1 Tax=uncultured Sulfurovum sp. TaxID=269237 RepID=A0A6S6S0Z7_9BACT|nr:MAG: Unknown protein [uncultured Sulfurovum sp.]